MSFTGFPKGGERFFQQLAIEMNREWFHANKAEYEDLWVIPMEALLETVHARISRAYKGIGLAEPKVFRIHRDVRFAKDKTPYKTHIAGVLMTKKGQAALYVSLGGDHEFTGAGAYHLEPDQLVRWRKALLDPKKGAEIAKLVAGARARKWELEAHGELVRVPRGFPAEHPRADLARMKGITVGFPAIPRGLIHKPGFATWLSDRAIQAAPLCTWIAKNVR
jgi:uncharacterized protein (TIGR02453 family)